MPLSRKLLYLIISILVGGLFTYASGSNPKENILPDVELPWNQSADKLVDTLNRIYTVAGQKIEWALCEAGNEGVYQMCLLNSDRSGPFKFIFSEGRLTGYVAEFSEAQRDNLVYSASVNYRGKSNGYVQTHSREFRVYEMEIKHGWLELYMVLDRDLRKVRVQAKYKYHGKKDKTKTPESDTEDQKAWEYTELNMVSATPTGMTGKKSLNSLSILTLEPLSSKNTKSMEDLSKRLVSLVLVRVLYITSSKPLAMLR